MGNNGVEELDEMTAKILAASIAEEVVDDINKNPNFKPKLENLQGTERMIAIVTDIVQTTQVYVYKYLGIKGNALFLHQELERTIPFTLAVYNSLKDEFESSFSPDDLEEATIANLAMVTVGVIYPVAAHYKKNGTKFYTDVVEEMKQQFEKERGITAEEMKQQLEKDEHAMKLQETLDSFSENGIEETLSGTMSTKHKDGDVTDEDREIGGSIMDSLFKS